MTTMIPERNGGIRGLAGIQGGGVGEWGGHRGREASEAGDEEAPAGAGAKALPGQDKSEACTIM